MEKPKQLETIDLSGLRELCQDYLDFVDSEDYHEDHDYAQYIFEKSIETIFGNDVWKFINSKPL